MPILARLLANVIRRLLRIVGAALTRASVRESHLQYCLAPLPLDRRASRYCENEKLSPDALDRSNDQPLPAISNCAPGLKWRVVCTTIRFRDSLLLSCSYLFPSLGSLLALPSRFDPLEFIVCFKNEATADLTCCDRPGAANRGPSLSLGKNGESRSSSLSPGSSSKSKAVSIWAIRPSISSRSCGSGFSCSRSSNFA